MESSKKKMGRPTSNPLIHDVKVRLSEDIHSKLLKHCDDVKKSKAEVIREWIEDRLS